MTTQDLLDELQTSPTDLARVVKAVSQRRASQVVVSMRAVEAWEERAPEAWARVSNWLAARGTTVVQV
jgi:hypothetical protein